jgi:hypothetical protein
VSQPEQRTVVASAAVVIVAHPPERRQPRAGPPAQAGHCCCCCCCLHSLGALIGAAVAPAIGRGQERSYLPIAHYWDEEDEYDDAGDSGEYRPRTPDIALPRSGPSSVALFWWVLLALIGLGTLLSVVSGPEGLMVGWVIMLMVLPFMQLGSALITCIALALSPRQDKRWQFIQLGKITLGVVIGTVAGIAAMFIIYFALSR